MSPEESESLRHSLLRFLANNPTRFGLPIGYLRALAASEGRRMLDLATVAAELIYLSDKGLAIAADKPVSPELAAYRITAAGRDYLAERGIA